MAPLTTLQIVTNMSTLVGGVNSLRASADEPAPNLLLTVINILLRRVRDERLAFAAFILALLAWVVVAISGSGNTIVVLIVVVGFVATAVVAVFAALICYFRGERSLLA